MKPCLAEIHVGSEDSRVTLLTACSDLKGLKARKYLT